MAQNSSPQLTQAANGSTYAVVVSSCDSYRDVWPYFFHFFFRHASNLPQPVQLVSNFTRYEDGRVWSALTGPDLHWGSNLAQVLNQIESDWVLYLQEDYFLREPVDAERMLRSLSDLQRLKGRFLSLRHHLNHGPKVAGTDFRLIPKHAFFGDLQAAFWERDLLLEVVCPHPNPWRAEDAIRALADTDGWGGFYCLAEETPPIFSYVEAVKGKFWKPDGLEFLRQQGLTPDFSVRPFPRAGQQWWAKGLRSLHKRRMGWRERLRSRWVQWAGAVPVKPLPILPS